MVAGNIHTHNTDDMMSLTTNNVPPLRKIQHDQKWEINLIMNDKKLLRSIITILIKRTNTQKTRKHSIPLKMLISKIK